MGKSLKGKELGVGISQRKDGTYQARFVDRFGKRRTIYSKTLTDVRKRLREGQYEDEKQLNVASSDITLNEWFDIWMETCKRNCRDTTKATYTTDYNRIRNSLGWRRLSSINLITMQQAFNDLKTDISRKSTRRVLINMYNKAIDADLVSKNIAMRINTVVNQDHIAKEPRVLTLDETELFLEIARDYRHYNVFSLALETGMRIGELLGLKWSDIDFSNRTIYVNRTLAYTKCRDESNPKYGRKFFEFHKPKTLKGKRKIPMTLKACRILERQKICKNNIKKRGEKPLEGFEDLVFVTSRNTPVDYTSALSVMRTISDRMAEGIDGFEPITPHALRHTFATRCIERWMNPKTLQAIMGHSDISITMNLYCHVTDDTLVSEMEKFESWEKDSLAKVV